MMMNYDMGQLRPFVGQLSDIPTTCPSKGGITISTMNVNGISANSGKQRIGRGLLFGNAAVPAADIVLIQEVKGHGGRRCARWPTAG